MKDYGIVEGSAEQAKPLIVNVDTVYVHDNIEKTVTEDGNAFYKYHEIQYGKNEFIEMIAKKNEQTENDLTDAQLALTELYETITGK